MTRLCTLVLLLVFSATAGASGPTELRIGYQKSSVNLLVARHLGLIEQRLPGVRVRWVEFPGGPPLLEALGAGALDFGMTGDTPPIFAQAAGRNMVYVGGEAPKPLSLAILVRSESNLTSLAGLRGKRVALQRGSSAHYLVLRALEKAGLRLADIQPVYLAPADARAAFESHGVDAWAIWDPYWAAAATDSHVRVLTTGVGLADDVSFYETSSAFAQGYPDTIERVFGALNEADRFVQTHRGEASALIASTTGIDLPTASAFLARRAESPVSVLGAEAVASQQAVADAFAQVGVIPHQVSIEAAVWQIATTPRRAASR